MKILKMIELLTILCTFACSTNTPQKPSAGGPCEYKKYPGHAKIVSIISKGQPHNYSHEIFEVKFSFDPDQKATERFAHTEGREFVLLLNNSEYPGPKFLEKYDIQVGKIFECHVKVITKGTCTPILFEFPTIKLDDYFEK